MTPEEPIFSRPGESGIGETTGQTDRHPRWRRIAPRLLILSLGVALLGCGCTSFDDYVHNGCKVGPNYRRPPAPLASAWIDAKNPRVKSAPANYSDWWTVFGDPVLNDLVRIVYEQNVNLRVAGTRVLEARAARAIAVGSLFPQKQTANGSYTHVQASQNLANPPPKPFFDDWATGFSLSWELDFWGRFRRTIESATDVVESSVDDYDGVMVTLIGDLAAAYVQYRFLEQQLVYTVENIRLQQGSLKIARDRFKAGQVNELGVVQATSLLEQLEATIPVLKIGIRQANNQLCVLLGMPARDLAARLGRAPIPRTPPEIVVGIPADLIRRRPDLRSAERLIAAQSAQIGVAEADLYPAFFINGTLGYEAKDFAQLFASKSFTGQVGPGFQWNILNYGRIANNVRLQDFKTQELVASYQQKVLGAAQEVENGIVAYLNSREEAHHLVLSVQAGQRTVAIAQALYKNGAIDFTPVFVAEQFLVQQENLLAQAQGDIALGLIAVYRALGGGWEYRLTQEKRAVETAAVSCTPPPIPPSKHQAAVVIQPEGGKP